MPKKRTVTVATIQPIQPPATNSSRIKKPSKVTRIRLVKNSSLPDWKELAANRTKLKNLYNHDKRYAAWFECVVDIVYADDMATIIFDDGDQREMESFKDLNYEWRIGQLTYA